MLPGILAAALAAGIPAQAREPVSLQAVLETAPGGAEGVIVLEDGEYTAAVTVSGSLSLAARNPGGVCIRAGGEHAFLVRGGRLELEGIRLSGAPFGAVRVEGGAFSAERCIFSGNRAGIRGGGIADETEAKVKEGGAVSAVDSTLELVLCELSGNSAAVRGGALAATRCRIRVLGCTIAGNNCEDLGGGAALVDSTGLVASTVIAGNWAYDGGGLYISGPRAPRLTHLTVCDNGARRIGGILCKGVSPLVSNSILWGNGRQAAGVRWRLSLVEGERGEGLLPCEDPLFADRGRGDYRLRPGSPCLDAGEPAGAEGVDCDAAGAPRVLGAAPDIGAYELDESGEEESP